MDDVDEATTNFLREWGSAGRGKPSSLVGTAPARPWDVQRAFEILSAAPRAPHATPYDTAVWFKELKDTSKAGEPFNTEWAEWANPVITSFFTLTSVLQEGDQTSWCAAFVNWCLAAGRKNISCSAVAQASPGIRKNFQAPPHQKWAIWLIFSGVEDGSRQRFGHVGFLSRPLGTPDPDGEARRAIG